MKSKIFYILIFLSLFGCRHYPDYVPSFENLHRSQFGATIDVVMLINNSYKNKVLYRGELIEVNDSSLVVLTDKTKKCIEIEKSKIYKFTVTYAKPLDYGWSITIFSLMSLTHGLGMVISLPVNLFSTIAITFDGASKFSYDENTISYENLKMFARFPQGIPPNIKLEDIK